MPLQVARKILAESTTRNNRCTITVLPNGFSSKCSYRSGY